MSNFGFTQLRLVRPYDVAFREARSAVRSRHILEHSQSFDSVAAAVDDCTLVVGTTSLGHRALHIPLYRLEAAARIINEYANSSSVGLLFGSEKFGLSNDDMSHCQWLLRIPTREEHGSMNLGQAVAICLYELQRDASAAEKQFARPERASAGNYERITAMAVEILSRSGYINETVSKSTELKLRRLIRRIEIPASDVETFLGILRQVLWKLKVTS